MDRAVVEELVRAAKVLASRFRQKVFDAGEKPHWYASYEEITAAITRAESELNKSIEMGR